MVIQGAHNCAEVMASEIDETTRAQISQFLDQPVFAGSVIKIMPDCHAGKGAVVGFTMRKCEFVIPNIIGVDIGCGMLGADFGVMEWFDPQAFDDFIRSNVPCGHAVRLDRPEQPPEWEEYWELSRKIGAPTERILRSIGTLGGGNHFIEAGLTPHRHLFVTVHTGSRNLGKRVAEYYQRQAADFCERYKISTPKGLEYVRADDPIGAGYMRAMKLSQQYATLNRTTIMSHIAEFLGKLPETKIECAHNYIGDDGVIRKGATSAKIGELSIIPFNMRDGLAVCQGLGNPRYNWSAPHGAGRRLSRAAAKRELDVAAFEAEMKDAGVWTSTADESTLDEAPEAYKPKDQIIQNISETVEVMFFVRPVYNFKAAE